MLLLPTGIPGVHPSHADAPQPGLFAASTAPLCWATGVPSSLWLWQREEGASGCRDAEAGGRGLETHHRNDFLIMPRPELTGPTLEIELPPPSPASPPSAPSSLPTPTPISESPVGRDQETETREWGRQGPHPLGATQQRWEQGRDREDGGDL